MNIMDRLIERELRTIDPEPGEPLRVKSRAADHPQSAGKGNRPDCCKICSQPVGRSRRISSRCWHHRSYVSDRSSKKTGDLSSKNGVRTALVGLPYRSWL